MVSLQSSSYSEAVDTTDYSFLNYFLHLASMTPHFTPQFTTFWLFLPTPEILYQITTGLSP